MRVGFIFTVPLGLVVLFIAGLPAMFNSEPSPDPESIILNDPSDYQSKAKDYAQLDERQKALDTCTLMEGQFSETDQDICFLDVYDVLGDIDGEIEVYEEMLARNLVERQVLI